MADSNLPESTKPMPSTAEINATLDEHKGVVYAIKTLSEKYGPPKGTWGGFFRVVMRQRAASNASARMGVNVTTTASVNAQSNAPSNVAPPNSGSKTGSVLEQSTPNVPMVIVREPDVIIQPNDISNRADMDIARVMCHPWYQQLMQQPVVPQQSSAQPPNSNFMAETTLMFQTAQWAFQVGVFRDVWRAVFLH